MRDGRTSGRGVRPRDARPARWTLGVAAAAAFASVLPDRRSGDALQLALVAALWFVAFVLGTAGAYWNGNAGRGGGVMSVAFCLGTSCARNAAELMPRSIGYDVVAAAVASVVTSFGVVWFFRVVGRMNPDYARQEVTWRRTDDADHPCEATVAGDGWRIRVNRGDGGTRYTLLVEDAPVLHLDDWPHAWTPYLAPPRDRRGSAPPA